MADYGLKRCLPEPVRAKFDVLPEPELAALTPEQLVLALDQRDLAPEQPQPLWPMGPYVGVASRGVQRGLSLWKPGVGLPQEARQASVEARHASREAQEASLDASGGQKEASFHRESGALGALSKVCLKPV